MQNIFQDLPRELFVGFHLAIGAAVGMVAWAFLGRMTAKVAAVVIGILAGLQSRVFKNGKGQTVQQNAPKGKGR